MNTIGINKFAAFLLILVLMFSTVFPKYTAAESVNDEYAYALQLLQDSYEITKNEAKQLYKDIEKSAEFYSWDKNGMIYFDAISASKNNLNPALIVEITSDLDKMTTAMKNNPSHMKSCPGNTSFSSGGGRAYFDDCDTREIVTHLILFAAAATIVGIIAGLLLMPVTAAIYAIAGVLIGAGAAIVANYNRGSGIRVNYNNSTAPIGIYPQG